MDRAPYRPALALPALWGALACTAESRIGVTFLASEGVMVSYAGPPFDDVTLVLVTHDHDDHFTPGSVARHLRANSRARLVTTPHAAAVTGQPDCDHCEGRVAAPLPAQGAVKRDRSRIRHRSP